MDIMKSVSDQTFFKMIQNLVLRQSRRDLMDEDYVKAEKIVPILFRDDGKPVRTDVVESALEKEGISIDDPLLNRLLFAYI